MTMYVGDAIDTFIAELDTLGLAPNTFEGQSGYLRRFGRVCAQEAARRQKRIPLRADEIDSKVITAYFATCEGGQGNRNNMLAPVKKFIYWLEAEGEIKAGAATRLLSTRKYKTSVRRPKYYIPVSDFSRALDISGERHPEDRAVMALALYTLARRSEISTLSLADIDMTGRTIKIYRQKRKRWTEMAMTPELYAELDSWLSWYAHHTGQAGVHFMLADHPDWKVIPRLIADWLLDERGKFSGSAVSHEIDPANSPSHLERVVKRVLDVTGAQTVDGRQVRHLGEGMHTIRRSGARAMLDYLSNVLGQDRALLRVATMLDHEDPKQTLIYIGLDLEREALNNWLSTNSMYGTGDSDAVLPGHHGSVRSLRSVPSDVRNSRAV